MSYSIKHIVVCVAGSLAIFIGAVAAGRQMAGSPLIAAVPSPLTEIKAKAAALTGSKSTPSLPEAEARFRNALSNDRFAEASRIVSGVIARGYVRYGLLDPLADFMAGIVDHNDPDVQRHLDAWVQTSRQDAASLMVRAQYSYSLGWDARGYGFYADTKQANFAIFVKKMKDALSDIDLIFKNNTNPPAYVYYMKLRVLQIHGDSRDSQKFFERSIEKHPEYFPFYRLMLSILQPKWGGSVHAMKLFVENYAQGADRYSILQLLQVELYKDIVEIASLSCRYPAMTEAERPICIGSEMRRMNESDLEANVQAALLSYTHIDPYQFGLAVRQPLQAVIDTAGAEYYASKLLQMTAEAMHSDVRLIGDHPGKNDYVVDELVASSWFRAGHFENALRKEKEAVDDLRRTRFPDKLAKDAALARIYLDMSRTMGRLHDYAGQAAYQRASHILGGRNSYEHGACFAQFKMGNLDEAITSCDEAVDDNSDDMETYYWRAQTYIDLKQPEKAIKDLERVAGSQHALRAASAINLSMIWFNRHDIATALKSLNRYAYLYDDTVTSREDVAIGYNNRCYAYMELGDLRRALDDCDNSLRFGNIPDAYKKKAELEKRLARLPI